MISPLVLYLDGAVVLVVAGIVLYVRLWERQRCGNCTHRHAPFWFCASGDTNRGYLTFWDRIGVVLFGCDWWWRR